MKDILKGYKLKERVLIEKIYFAPMFYRKVGCKNGKNKNCL